MSKPVRITVTSTPKGDEGRQSKSKYYGVVVVSEMWAQSSAAARHTAGAENGKPDAVSGESVPIDDYRTVGFSAGLPSINRRHQSAVSGPLGEIRPFGPVP